MINVKAQLMERDAIFVQSLANYLKCNAIELLMLDHCIGPSCLA